MKLLCLRLKNINSIREEVTLDFENGPLFETSLFAITGPTGAGKSTLLDALSVALFHKTPRLDGSSAKNAENLLSQGSTEGFAEVLFKVNQMRYLAEWRVKRTKSGKTNSSVKLIEVGTGRLLNDKKTTRPIEEILGLDFNSFRRSVLLAQGEFAAFLKASSDDKRKLLENVTGIDVFVALGEVLNEQRKNTKTEFDQQQKILETIPKSDKDTIQAAEKEFQELQKSLKSAQEMRTKIRSENEAETRRLNNWTSLKQSELRLGDLLKQEAEIEQLDQEISIARTASELLPVSRAYESEQKNLSEILASVETVQKAAENANSAQETQETVFQKITHEYETERAGSKAKFELLDEAARQEVEARSIQQEAQKRSRELAKLQAENSEAKSALTQKVQALQGIEVKISQASAKLESLVVPENHAQILSELNQKVATHRARLEKQNDLGVLGKKKKAEFTRVHEEIQQISEKITQQLRENEKLSAARVEAENALTEILNSGDEAQLEERRNLAVSLQELALNYETFVAEQNKFATQAEQLQEAVQKSESALEALKRTISVNDGELALLKERVGRMEAEEKHSALSEYVLQLRKDHLRENEPCPVCGGTAHPWANDLEPVTDEALQQLREALAKDRADAEERNAIQTKLSQQEVRLSTTLQQEQFNLSEAAAQRDKLNEKLVACQKEWPQEFDGGKISSNFIKHEIRNCDEQIRAIRTAQQRVEEVEKRLLNSAPEISANQTQVKNLENQFNSLNIDLEELRDNYKKIRDSLNQLESEIQQKLPENYHSQDVEKSVRQFEESIRVFVATEKQLAQLNQQQAQIKTQVEENQKFLQQSEKRIEMLQMEINSYEKQAQDLLNLAQEKTGGLTAKEARLQIEQRLQNLENEKNQADQLLQTRREEATGTRSRLEELRKRAEKIKQNFENAEQTYLTEIQNANFDSIEAHQQALRTPEWFQQQNQVIENYRKQVYFLDQEIKRLSSEFDKAPFEPNHLEKIRRQEQELDEKIEILNAESGTIREKIKQLKIDLETYQRIEQEVENARQEFERWQKLHELMGANKLRDYALRSMFHLLIQYANQQMQQLTSRYVLKVKDLRDMVVVDTWNAGEERPVETLSGGESFLTSLALALALSELSKGRAQLESLFLDEGFGSLDQDTLELALDSLEGLRQSGRKVGVISHVQELTRRIPVRIAVKKKGDGSSSVAVEGTV